jgi:hypothetical protein
LWYFLNARGSIFSVLSKAQDMKYAFEDLSEGQFESLVVAICQFVLGTTTQGFAAGPDGGRDAKFVGTAELIPSRANPWIGIVIVQAKHTNGFNMSFSDSNFFSQTSKNTVLGEELPRIKKLRDSNALDHYILFSNRKLTGNAESKIRRYISNECGIPESSIFLCDDKQLEMWLKRFPQAAEMADINPIDSPLIVSPDELATLIESLAEHLNNTGVELNDPPTDRVSYDLKNQLNNMTPEYALEMRRRYLKETPQIKNFLSAPENADLLKLYESATEEFQVIILAKHRDYQTFDNVIVYLRTLLFARDPILRRNKRLTSAMLFYMYWNCDIGRTVDA